MMGWMSEDILYNKALLQFIIPNNVCIRNYNLCIISDALINKLEIAN